MFINADRVFLEIFVTRASAPALPRSELKDTDSRRNDLLCIEFEVDLLGAGVAEEAVLDGLATQTRLQVNFLPPTTVVAPALVHFDPFVLATDTGVVVEARRIARIVKIETRFT
jgi:hypothetical protein